MSITALSTPTSALLKSRIRIIGAAASPSVLTILPKRSTPACCARSGPDPVILPRSRFLEATRGKPGVTHELRGDSAVQDSRKLVARRVIATVFCPPRPRTQLAALAVEQTAVRAARTAGN